MIDFSPFKPSYPLKSSVKVRIREDCSRLEAKGMRSDLEATEDSTADRVTLHEAFEALQRRMVLDWACAIFETRLCALHEVHIGIVDLHREILHLEGEGNSEVTWSVFP